MLFVKLVEALVMNDKMNGVSSGIFLNKKLRETWMVPRCTMRDLAGCRSS